MVNWCQLNNGCFPFYVNRRQYFGLELFTTHHITMARGEITEFLTSMSLCCVFWITLSNKYLQALSPGHRTLITNLNTACLCLISVCIKSDVCLRSLKFLFHLCSFLIWCRYHHWYCKLIKTHISYLGICGPYKLSSVNNTRCGYSLFAPGMFARCQVTSDHSSVSPGPARHWYWCSNEWMCLYFNMGL